MFKEVQRYQPPIEAIETKVFREPVLELILALAFSSATEGHHRSGVATTHGVEGLNIGHVLLY